MPTAMFTKQETFSSLLDRLSCVISNTQENAAVAEKIGYNVREATQQLGFTAEQDRSEGEESDGFVGMDNSAPVNALQRLDKLIMQLGDANLLLARNNHENDHVRSCLQSQL